MTEHQMKLGPEAQAFFFTLVNMMDHYQAENFVSFTIGDGKHKYGITIQRSDGEDTPADKIDRLTEIIIDAWSQFGYATKDGIIDGGHSTLEDIRDFLKKDGYIDEKGNILFWSAAKKCEYLDNLAEQTKDKTEVNHDGER